MLSADAIGASRLRFPFVNVSVAQTRRCCPTSNHGLKTGAKEKSEYGYYPKTTQNYHPSGEKAEEFRLQDSRNVVESMPAIGTVFDAVWKANERNVALLKKELGTTQP